MATTQDIVKRIGEIERNISDGETLLRRLGDASKVGWFFLAVGILLIIFLDGGYKVIGLLVLGASIWRLYKAEKYKKEVEEGLREYRGQKAELQATLAAKE